MALVAFSHGDLPRASLGARLIIACCPRPTWHGTDREIYGPANLGDGFIDGISFDSYGNLWGTMVIADRLIAITPQGDVLELLDDGNHAANARAEAEYATGNPISFETLNATGGSIATVRPACHVAYRRYWCVWSREDGADSPSELQEVAVTVQRSVSGPQTTPLAVTDLSGPALKAPNVTNLDSLALAVPGVSFGDELGEMHIAIRGIGSDAVNWRRGQIRKIPRRGGTCARSAYGAGGGV
jgi:hypothetical protein